MLINIVKLFWDVTLYKNSIVIIGITVIHANTKFTSK